MSDFTDERVRALLKGRRAVRVYPLPSAAEDSELTIGVRALTGEEIDEARTEAVQYTEALAKRRKIDPRELQWVDGDPHQAEVQRQIVYRACVEPELREGEKEYRPFFPSVAALRQSDDTFVQMLWHLYHGHQRFANPYAGVDEDVAGIIDALKKTPERKAVLALYDAPTLLTLVATLVDQLASSPTGK